MCPLPFPFLHNLHLFLHLQGELISRSESELAESLLEHVEIFVEIIVSKREFSNPTVSTPVVLSNNDMDHLRTVLQEDIRYVIFIY